MHLSHFLVCLIHSVAPWREILELSVYIGTLLIDLARLLCLNLLARDSSGPATPKDQVAASILATLLADGPSLLCI